MNMSVTKSPLLHLPQALQKEIAFKLQEIDRRMMTLGLEERGGVCHWLRDGQKPTEQLALALRDAPEADWADLVQRFRTAGSPIAGSVGAGDRAAHELKHKWRAVIRGVWKMVPEDADLEQWCGFVRLAEAMMETANE